MIRFRRGHQVHHCAIVIGKRSLARTRYLTTSSAACGQIMAVNREAGRDRVVAFYGDRRFSSHRISNGLHISTPAGEVMIGFRHGHQVHHCAIVIGKQAFARIRYLTTSSAACGQIMAVNRKAGRDGDIPYHVRVGPRILRRGIAPLQEVIAGVRYRLDRCSTRAMTDSLLGCAVDRPAFTGIVSQGVLVHREVGHDRMISTHRDRCCRRIHVVDGAHITGPLDEVVILIGFGHQLDHRLLVI